MVRCQDIRPRASRAFPVEWVGCTMLAARQSGRIEKSLYQNQFTKSGIRAIPFSLAEQQNWASGLAHAQPEPRNPADGGFFYFFARNPLKNPNSEKLMKGVESFFPFVSFRFLSLFFHFLAWKLSLWLHEPARAGRPAVTEWPLPAPSSGVTIPACLFPHSPRLAPSLSL